MLAVVALAAYVWALNSYDEGAHARTVALLSLVGVQLGHLFNCRSRTRSAFDGFFSNPYIFVAAAIVIALQLFAVFNPFLSSLLGLETPNLQDWIVIGMSVVLPIAIVEIWKVVVRARRGASGEQAS
jgi:magnesium-transporting ATPase (P-type)